MIKGDAGDEEAAGGNVSTNAKGVFCGRVVEALVANLGTTDCSKQCCRIERHRR